MKSAISRYPLVSFFVMAFLFSWIAVLPLILNHRLPIEPFQICGSILLMILLHSSSTAAISVGSKVLPSNLSESMNFFVYSGWIPAITYTIIALVVIIVTRSKLSYGKE